MHQSLGPFRILAKIGEGGMGAVYSARDERLDRVVAIKVIRSEGADASARERIRREAMAAARVNHPNVCQIYEIGEHQGESYIAMEFLEGEPLSARLARAAVPPAEGFSILLGILGALEALHARGVVHRDLKPANVFLTPHGVKVLDFGLARPDLKDDDRTRLQLTTPGMLVGTPRYMSPEQWAGEPAGTPCDLFAAGALLFEILTGKPAFEGSTLPEVCRAVMSDRPPALTGGPAVAAADRIIGRALAKRPEERFPDAASMAREIREALRLVDSGGSDVQEVRAVKRLAVLPFKPLRPDPDTDFLAMALPDAVATALAGLQSLVVRSPLATARFASEAVDLKRIAAEAEVDSVLSATLLRAGEAVRVSAQLIAAPAGTVVWSKTVQAPIRDLFQLQDELTRQMVESLSIPLSPKEDRMLRHDVPAHPKAYEIFLRANQVHVSLTSTSTLLSIRDLYRASLDEDPHYAPAWARLGRIYRILAKYAHGDVEENRKLAKEAFDKALSLNPDLPLAHNLYTNFEVEDLGRCKEAMARLLPRAQAGSADPNLFAGLVHACRYGGLLDASIAAHERARRLDPAVRTGVQYAYYLKGDYVRAAEAETDHPPVIRIRSLIRMGRREEARALYDEAKRRPLEGLEALSVEAFGALVEDRREDGIRSVMRLVESSFRDPEGLFLTASCLALWEEHDPALALLRRVVDAGFWCAESLRTDPWLDSLRGRAEFNRILDDAEERRRGAAVEFIRGGGEKLLGVSVT